MKKILGITVLGGLIAVLSPAVAFAHCDALDGPVVKAARMALWFSETLVRIHRTGEGASFDGLTPAGQAAPLVIAVDKTLEAGSADDVVALVATHVTAGVKEHFEHAREAKAHAGESVEAGRRFVAAYVAYVHLVRALQRVEP